MTADITLYSHKYIYNGNDLFNCHINPKFSLQKPQRPQFVFHPIGSMYSLLFVVMSAHTLLGPFILMLRPVDQTLCLDQLYSCTIIMLSSLCTPVRHFVAFCCTHFDWPSLLYNLTLPTHTCGAHTLLGSVVLLYINTVVQPRYTCTVNLF